MMFEGWNELLVILGVSLPLGVAIGLGLRWWCPRFSKRFREMAQATSWPYLATGTVWFLALAALTLDQPGVAIIFLFFAAWQAVAAGWRFWQQRSQYGLRHLFWATTVFAVIAACARWFGMAIVPVLAVASGNAVLVLFVLEWRKQLAREAARESAAEEETADGAGTQDDEEVSVR